jgi:hypothetical protein
MKKVINPIMRKVSYKEQALRVFITIEFKDGKLSITGVESPMSNGNCKGSCGQIDDDLRIDNRDNWKYLNGWNDEMMTKLLDIWDKWHLNDMHPYCEHQKQLGWRELASKKVTIYHYRITNEAQKMKKMAEESALNALREGKTFTPSEEQILYATLPYAVKHYKELSESEAKYYEPKKPIYQGDTGSTEIKTLGWLNTTEHPDGILSKPCPVCGYKYGTSWKKEDVPQDVIDWLFALPNTEVKPAWI